MLILLVTACAGGTTSPDAGGGSVDFGQLNSAVADVAALQGEADSLLADHLAALRRFDALIEELRDPDQVDAAKDRWGPVADDLSGFDATALRRRYREVASAVDEARRALAAAREDVATDWESRYLAAQDDVLEAVRDHARAADALAQILEDQWELYGALRDMTATFVEQRWFYRTSQEAADAYELELRPHLDDLREARVLIARFTAERDDAALIVNQASADAAAIWAARPTGATPGAGDG